VSDEQEKRLKIISGPTRVHVAGAPIEGDADALREA